MGFLGLSMVSFAFLEKQIALLVLLLPWRSSLHGLSQPSWRACVHSGFQDIPHWTKISQGIEAMRVHFFVALLPRSEQSMRMRKAKVLLTEAIPMDFDLCNGIKSTCVQVLRET